MSAAMTKIAKKKGRLPALVASLGILGWLMAVTLVGLIMQLVAVAGQSISTDSGIVVDPGLPPDYLVSALIRSLLGFALPFCLGVFLCLWAIAPISHELTLRFVLTRGALATAAGAIIAFIVEIFIHLFDSFSPGTTFFGNTFPFSSFSGTYFLSTFGGALQGLVLTFLHNLPLVLLATVLLWLWLKAHPREYAVSGLIDDV